MNKGFKEKVLQCKLNNPALGFSAIGKLVGCSHNAAKYHLSPKTKTDVDERRRLLDALNIEKLKIALGGKCSKCGYSKCMQALHFHHKDPATKAFCVTRYRSNYEKCAEEAKKCILLCANCHHEHHFMKVVEHPSYPPG